MSVPQLFSTTKNVSREKGCHFEKASSFTYSVCGIESLESIKHSPGKRRFPTAVRKACENCIDDENSTSSRHPCTLLSPNQFFKRNMPEMPVLIYPPFRINETIPDSKGFAMKTKRS
jgi:hypothetical protein